LEGFRQTVSSMPLSRNAASYFPRPRLRSQTTMSLGATQIRLLRMIVRSGESVQEVPEALSAGAFAVEQCQRQASTKAIQCH
jgi:hypothetical protein